ncbi:MAG: pilus motility taxis protein HmpF [Microcoleaceae cyanobacterium]
MLYLAEVQKQRSGFGLGGAKAELKLLACQRGENQWSAVSGDEVVVADDANSFKDGALVLVDLSSSKQVQRIQEASRQLVLILQDFSRHQDKTRRQEDEIEQWKESLTYQSQELNRREMELEARQEQLVQLEADLEQLDQQRQEVETAQAEGNQLQIELNQQRSEIETAQAELHQQIQQLEAQRTELQANQGLSEEQIQVIQDLLQRDAPALTTEPILNRLQQILQQLTSSQGLIDQHWQQLQQKQQNLLHVQREIEERSQNIQSQWRQWDQAQSELIQTATQLKAEQTALQAKQDQASLWASALSSRQQLLQQLEQLSVKLDDSAEVDVKIDVAALEAMPITQLQTEVEKLQQEWDRFFRMVKEQEEELKSKQEEIDEIQQKISTVADPERSELQSELVDEQDAYQMLNETLVGQRRTLREREERMQQHQGVLFRRQGVSNDANTNGLVSFESVIADLHQQSQQQSQQYDTLNGEIERLQATLTKTQDDLERQTHQQQEKRQYIRSDEYSLREQYQSLAQLQGQVSLHQELLQPLQNHLSDLKQQLEETTGELNQLNQAAEQRSQTWTELKSTLEGLLSG